MDEWPPVKREAWQTLGDAEAAEILEAFRTHLKFGLGTALQDPVIEDPEPSVTFDLSVIGTGAEWAASVEAINAEALRCFMTALPDVDELIVIDWYHPTYRVKPRVEALDSSPRDPINGYPTVYPDGDYFAFLTPDMREGTFGHPWEPSLCVIGQRLIDTLGASLATWLPIKRTRLTAPHTQPIDPTC